MIYEYVLAAGTAAAVPSGILAAAISTDGQAAESGSMRTSASVLAKIVLAVTVGVVAFWLVPQTAP
jgi:hypothetical protein